MIKYANKIIKELVSIGERQLDGEKKARKLIENFLKENGVEYKSQEYNTYIPEYKDWGLKIDEKKIECLPCGLKSGKIENKNTILSSLISSQKNFYDTNINFNPNCDVISRSNYYMAPALAVAKKDVFKVINGEKIEGFMNVEKKKHTSANILVGNLKNPKNIIFSHYDSISVGAVDNASGVALSLELIVDINKILNDTLFVIAGNEEISYDETVYWGHGYREFQKKYLKILKNSKNIFILDSFGHSPLELIEDPAVIKLGFPIENMDSFVEKIKFFAGSFDGLMKFYHAENDLPETIKDEYLFEVKDEILKLIKN